MKFIVTENEKNHIKGLYMLNEQSLTSFLKGKKVSKDIILTKVYTIGFENGKRGKDNITEKPVKFRLKDGPNNISVDGDKIKVNVTTYQNEKIKLIYTCSSNEIIRDDNFLLYSASYVGDENDVETLKDKLKLFCKV